MSVDDGISSADTDSESTCDRFHGCSRLSLSAQTAEPVNNHFLSNEVPDTFN